MDIVAFWPLSRRYPNIIHRPGGGGELLFTDDGKWLALISEGKLRLLPMSMDAGAESRILLKEGLGSIPQMQLDAVNRRLVVAGDAGRIWLVPLDGGQPRSLPTGFSANLMAVALGPQGRLVAASIMLGPAEEKVIRILDIDSGEVRVLGPPEGAGDGADGTTYDLEFTSDERLLSVGDYGLLHWNLNDESAEVLDRGPWNVEAMMKLSPDSRFAFVQSAERGSHYPELKLYDLDEGTSRVFLSHGRPAYAMAFDPTGKFIVTGNLDGEIRVGPVSGEEPHLLLGHEAIVGRIAVSPDGRWIATGSNDRTLRIWPMPDLKKPPFHTLPYDELLKRLRSLTNLRVVTDRESSTGYRIDIGPFPGWEKVPVW